MSAMNKAWAVIISLCVGLCSVGWAAATVTDETGRTVEVPDRPGRIIGLTPSLTEILFALGLGDRVVGATTWADYPEEARTVTRVGDYASPNLERIVSLKPDLVLANVEGNPPWVAEKLEAAGIAVYCTRPDDPLALPASLRRLGEICGASEKGWYLADRLQGMFDRVRSSLAEVEPRPTLLVIGANPLVSVGRDTFNGKMLVLAAAENIAAGAPGRWPRLSLEYVLEMQPEVVVISTMDRGADVEQALDFWRNLPGLKECPGLRVGVIESDLIDRPGPRLEFGLEKLVRLIHGERFGEGEFRP
jgi:iron complex transport system substrate-binding protein